MIYKITNIFRFFALSILLVWNVNFVGAAEQNNILLIIVDDLRPELGCYGNGQMITPGIDKLATQGMVFDRAYCNVPVCMPSRVSLLTGMPADRTMGRTRLLGREFITLPKYLKDHGYTTISNGKVFHFIEDRAEDWSEPPWRSVPIYHGEVRWATYNNYGLWQNEESGKLINPETGFGPFYDSADVPDDAYQDGKVANKTIADLKRFAESNEPFFLACGFWRPHLPFNAPKKYWDLYEPEKLAMADNRFRAKNLPQLCQNSIEMFEYAGIDGFPDDDAFHRKALHGYYACVSYIDAQVGKLLAALKENGLDKNTVVVLIGDHGWHLGEHNFWGKHNTLNNALHSPLIIRAPGYPGGKHSLALTQYIDLYPTLADIVGLDIPVHTEGRSLAPLLENPGMAWRDALFFFWNEKQHENNKVKLVDAIAVKTDRFLYTEWHEKGEVVDCMLFDHKIDPGENINIAGKPDMHNTVKDLSKRIEDFMASTSFRRRGEKSVPGVTSQEQKRTK
jgi:arylsulfatase A-like enzyme